MTKASGTDPLVIRSVEFVGGMADPGGWRPPSDLPEIAFAGRSNVGKSSLLNSVLRRKSIARVSRTPGRTREINFFRLNGSILLADLPGYGYARVSKERKSVWGRLVEEYLRRNQNLKGVIQLLDIRRDPAEDDRMMLEFLSEVGVPTLVVLTKADKLPRKKVTERAQKISNALNLDPEQVLTFSSKTGEGRDDLAAALVSLVDLR